MTLDTRSVALDGIGSGMALAVLGWKLIWVEVEDNAPGSVGGRAAATGERRRQGQRYIVKYRGRNYEWDPERETDKKMVTIHTNFNGHASTTKMLVDTKHIPAIISVANWIEASYREISVRIDEIKSSAKTMSVKAGELLRPKNWWRR